MPDLPISQTGLRPVINTVGRDLNPLQTSCSFVAHHPEGRGLNPSQFFDHQRRFRRQSPWRLLAMHGAQKGTIGNAFKHAQ